MHSRYFTPRQWNPYVPAELKEPFPWAHRDDPVQRRSNVDGVPFPFRSPRAILLCGCVLLLLSIIGITLLSFSPASAGMTVLAGAFFTGGSVFVVYIGVARVRWERRFTQRMGFSPFDRRPTDVPGLAQHTDPL